MPPMPAVTASSISSRLLATPLKTSCAGGNPARSAFQSSPPELTSAPAPAARICSRNQRLEHALLAKNTRLAACRDANARRRRATLAAMRACEYRKNGVSTRPARPATSTPSNSSRPPSTVTVPVILVTRTSVSSFGASA